MLKPLMQLAVLVPLAACATGTVKANGDVEACNGGTGVCTAVGGTASVYAERRQSTQVPPGPIVLVAPAGDPAVPLVLAPASAVKR